MKNIVYKIENKIRKKIRKIDELKETVHNDIEVVEDKKNS
jgi:hypothetical protein